MIYLACFIGGMLFFILLGAFLTSCASEEDKYIVFNCKEKTFPTYYEIKEKERIGMEMQMRYEHIESRIKRLEEKVK